MLRLFSSIDFLRQYAAQGAALHWPKIDHPGGVVLDAAETVERLQRFEPAIEMEMEMTRVLKSSFDPSKRMNPAKMLRAEISA